MIYKKAKIGERDDVTVVEMGTGDIHIVGIDWNEEGHHGVLFSQDVPKDISKWNDVQNPISDISEAKNPVVIYFSREEAVDQLIDTLFEVKEAFHINRRT